MEDLKAALDDIAAAESQINPELVPSTTPTPAVSPTPSPTTGAAA